MVEAYMVLLRAPKEKIAGKIYNAGYENQSVKDIAEIVKNAVGSDVTLTTTPSDDNRSYHISSEKIKNELGFVAKHTIRDAVEDLCEAFDKKLLPNSLDDEIYFNIKRMQNINLS
jgi:nucleoside-diphosphate-sugar epimerase